MRNRQESDLDGQSAHITKEQQEELLQQAKEAAASGNPGRMLEALHGSFALDGLTRRIASKWQKLSRDEVDFILAEAVDILYLALRDGRKVFNLVAYLWKTSNPKACDYYRTKQNEKPLTPDEWEHISNQSTEIEESPDNSATELGWEEKRPRVIAVVRSLLPRLGQHNAQAVMTYILDALSSDCMDISNVEIAEALGLS